MASRLNPYLNFNGTARQALEFYNDVFGGELTLSTFAEFGMCADKFGISWLVNISQPQA